MQMTFLSPLYWQALVIGKMFHRLEMIAVSFPRQRKVSISNSTGLSLALVKNETIRKCIDTLKIYFKIFQDTVTLQKDQETQINFPM